MKIQNSLTGDQKQAIGLLVMGTFLEYFDLMLYVHMAVLLNDIFFPKTDPYIASLLAAFAFCYTYALRPFGALLFGWIGDNIGRKVTVTITPVIMASCCLTMAVLPSYAEIGIAASYIMIACRVIQGLSSLGEVTGAELYVTEITKPPLQYVAVGIVSVCTLLGGLAALGFATLCTKYFLNWRYAFFAGSIIALVGAAARTTLRETPEFADAKKRFKRAMLEIKGYETKKIKQFIRNNPAWNAKVDHKTSLAYLVLLNAWPAFFFLIYIYCGNIFKSKFGYSGADVIQNNLYVALFNAVVVIFLIFLSAKVHPLRILKVRAIISIIATPFCLYCLSVASTPQQLFLIQLLTIVTSVCFDPVSPVVFKRFPVFKRFTYTSMIHAISKILVYFVTSFGMVFLTKSYEYWGILLVLLPICLAFYWGTCYFEKLEMSGSTRVWL